MTRLESMSLKELAKLMIYIVMTREGFRYHTPMNTQYPDMEAAINATEEWLAEQV